MMLEKHDDITNTHDEFIVRSTGGKKISLSVPYSRVQFNSLRISVKFINKSN